LVDTLLDHSTYNVSRESRSEVEYNLERVTVYLLAAIRRDAI